MSNKSRHSPLAGSRDSDPISTYSIAIGVTIWAEI